MYRAFASCIFTERMRGARLGVQRSARLEPLGEHAAQAVQRARALLPAPVRAEGRLGSGLRLAGLQAGHVDDGPEEFLRGWRLRGEPKRPVSGA